jgi:hypothetical protein
MAPGKGASGPGHPVFTSCLIRGRYQRLFIKMGFPLMPSVDVCWVGRLCVEMWGEEKYNNNNNNNNTNVRPVCDHSLAGIVDLNPGRAWMPVSCEYCVLSGRGPCDGVITFPEESYRVWSV